MNFLETLEINCEACEGIGTIPEIVRYGRNKLQSYTHQAYCEKCEGEGKFLTETGKQFVQFLERQIRRDSDGTLGRAIREQMSRALRRD